MITLVPNNNYLLKLDTYCPKSLQKKFNKHYKFIKKKETKLQFTNGENSFTLWSNHRTSDGSYDCFITLEQNNNYRTTNHHLNSNSCYVWIKIHPIQIQFNYLESNMCVSTILDKFIFIVDFYNKINIKKNWKKVPSITKVFQDNYMVRYISEFL
jgi:hypothetical protein